MQARAEFLEILSVPVTGRGVSGEVVPEAGFRHFHQVPALGNVVLLLAFLRAKKPPHTGDDLEGITHHLIGPLSLRSLRSLRLIYSRSCHPPSNREQAAHFAGMFQLLLDLSVGNFITSVGDFKSRGER